MSKKQPTSLVKFTDAETAVRILSDSKLRWSAPCLFDDPFELNHRSTLNFDSKALLLACVKNTLGLIFSRDEPSGNSPLIKAIKRWRVEDRFDSEDEATEVLSELLVSMVNHREPEMLQIVRDWKKYSESLRILCLSETHESTIAWDKYADHHSGIAIRISCGDECSLEKPTAVHYSDHKPELSSLSEQMDILMNQTDISVQSSFEEKYLCKSKSSSAEKEWRVIKKAEDDSTSLAENQWYQDIEFSKQELKAVYFGANLSSENQNAINKVIASKYPKAKLFQAQPSNNRFELSFERLNGN